LHIFHRVFNKTKNRTIKAKNISINKLFSGENEKSERIKVDIKYMENGGEWQEWNVGAR